MTTTERPKLNWRKSETHGLEPDPEPRADPLHDHLGRRPPGRAARHVRRPPARQVAGAGAAGRRDRRRPRGLGVRRAALLPGRTQRGRRSQARGLEGRADALRRDAARLLRHRRPRQGHGHQRRLGVGQLPVADHRLLRPGVLAVLRPRARPRGHARLERLVPRRVVLAASRSASSRWASRTSAIPRRARPRSVATPSAGSPPSRCPRCRTASACPICLDGWWDPIIEACAETDTVICLHVGSSGVADMPPGRARWSPLGATLFGQLSLEACAEWLWSGYAVKHPDLKIAMSRGRHRLGRDAASTGSRTSSTVPATGSYFPERHAPGRGAAAQLLVLHDRRSVDDLDPRDRSASTTSCSRPTTRTATARGPTPRPCSSSSTAGLPADEIAMISHENAAALFRHPLPPADSRFAAGLRS